MLNSGLKYHDRKSSLPLYDSVSTFFQTEPSFKHTPQLNRLKKKSDNKSSFFSLKSTPIRVKNGSPLQIKNRLRPVVLYNKDSDMNKCYMAAKSCSLDKKKDLELIEIQRKLREKSILKCYEDDKIREIVGNKALLDYHDVYKNLDKIKDQNKAFKIKESIMTKSLSSLTSRNLLPLKMGVIKYKGKSTELELNHYKLGEKYGIALSESIKLRTDLKTIDLRDNNLNAHSAREIINNINSNTKNLMFSQNQIGKEGCISLTKLISEPKQTLTEINLEDNKLTDQSIQSFLFGLKNNNSIKKLDLSKNRLTDQSAKIFKEVLKINDTLQELYLHWNQIQGEGACSILEPLQNNDCLKVLDLSWNAIGSNSIQYSKKIGDFLKNDKKVLIHLDLSFNNFNLEESKIIQKSLLENHILFGFHFRGNYGFVDNKGFLIIPEDFEKEIMIYFAPKNRIKGVSKIITNFQDLDPKYKDCCWICDGWQEATFTFNLDHVSDIKLDDCFIHFELENWKAIPLERISNKTFQLKRMCPRGQTRFFFTVNNIQIASDNFPLLVMEDPIIKNVQINEKLIIPEVYITEINYIDIFSEDYIINQYTYSPLIDSFPRPEYRVNIPEKSAKIEWKIENSIFKDFAHENEDDIIGKCFETDYKNSKISKFSKSIEEEENLKNLLRSNYKKIKELYHYLAALSPTGNILCITQNTLSEFVKNCNLLDSKYLKFSDIDLSYLSAYIPLLQINSKEESNSGRYLIRCQFMEMIVRLASDRYLKYNLEENIVSSVERVLNEHILPFFQEFDHEYWKEMRFWNVNCDKVIKKFNQILQLTYKKYASKFSQSIFGLNVVKNVYLTEFKKVFEDCELIDSLFTERDANLAFSMTIKYHENEINSDRFLQLNFMEFIEALARASEKISLYPIGIENKYEWPLAKRMALPLWIKFESMCTCLMKYNFDKNLKDLIGIPKKSMFDNEIEFILSMSPNRIKGPIRNSFVIKESPAGKGDTFKEKLKKSLNLSVVLNKIVDIVQMGEKSPIKKR